MVGQPVVGKVLAAATTPAPSSLDNAVQTTLMIGWSMATLANPRPSILVLLGQQQSGGGFHLPTEHELDQDRRIQLEIRRLDSLLQTLRLNHVVDATAFPSDASALSAAWQLGTEVPTNPEEMFEAEERLRRALLSLNFEILTGLASTNPALELAYETGRALRDTSNPPTDAPMRTGANQSFFFAWVHQLGRQRIARLQEWLKILNAHFPNNTGIIASTSLGKWSELGFFLFEPGAPGRVKGRQVGSNSTKTEFARSLLDQGDIWIGLLTGKQSTEGLLTPESYVAAGEASLNRSARIIRRIVLHYWFVLAVLLLAGGGVFYLAMRDLGGAAKAWTQIGAILSSLGITARGIASRIGRLSSAAETPIYEREKLDAMAWAVTTLPTVKVSNRKLRAMRRSGIQRSRSLARG